MELNKILKEFSQETGSKVQTAADIENEDKKNGDTTPNFITYKDNSISDEKFQPPTDEELKKAVAEMNQFLTSENFIADDISADAQIDYKEKKQTDSASSTGIYLGADYEKIKPKQAADQYEKIPLPNFPNLANYLNSLDIEIVAKTYLQPANNDTFVCPNCGAGTHGHHNTGAEIDTKRNKLHCFSCGKVDDSVLDLICRCENLNNRGKDFIRAMKIACDIFNISDAQSFDYEKISAQIKPAPNNETSKEKFHYSRLDEARGNLKKFFDDNSGTFRGIPFADYARARAGYLLGLYFHELQSKHPAIIFENDIGGIFARAVDDVDGKENIGKTFTTSLKVPTADFEKEIVLIVESVIDALSILYATNWKVNVIATGGTNGLPALRQSLKRLFPAEKPNLILMLDNDDKDGRNAGQDAAADWIRTLRAEGYVIVNRVLTDEKNVDPNTFLISYGVDALRTRIKEIFYSAQSELSDYKEKIAESKVADENSLYDEREISIYDFFNFEFDKCVAEFKKYAHRQTGFKNFDEIQRLLPGLYIIGALPGVGKSTFSWQLANQIAELNQRDNVDEDVIFISYEMSRLAMFAKTLSRFLYLKDKSTNLTATDISCGGTSSTMQEVLQTIRKTTKNRRFSMFELHEPDIDELIKKISPHCKNEKSPVVVIDYLQIVPPTSNAKTDDRKGNIDNTLRQLKKFQLQTNATIFVISSLNRDSYNRVELNLDSFSGSSGIEYTADVIFGMELFDFKEGNTDKKELMRRQPRPIRLTCLKNRFGALYEIFFYYYSAHDYFVSVTLDDAENNSSGRKCDR